eukprot:jgi/Bigna1/66645/fgenesh1_pg.2_\
MDESNWAIDTGKHVRVHWRHDGQVKCWTCVVGKQKGASFSVREVGDEWKFVRRTCIEDAVKDACSACSDGSRGRCSHEAMEHDPQDMPSFEQTHSNQKGVVTENNRSVEGMSLDWIAPCESNESCHNQKASRPPSEWQFPSLFAKDLCAICVLVLQWWVSVLSEEKQEAQMLACHVSQGINQQKETIESPEDC